MSELLEKINTDTNKEAISVKEITKALESGFFDTQENITAMIQELDHIDNTLERSCVQSLLKVAYTQLLYDKLQQYPELMKRLQVWSQEQYMNNLSLDEKKIGGLSLISLPKKPEDVTITTLSKYINTANTLPEHHDMLVKVLQEQMKLLNQLCPDKKSLLDMTWNSKKNGLDAPVLKFKTLQQLSDRIKKEAQVRKEYEAIKSTSLKQIDPGKLSKDVLKLWTITKLSTFPTELTKLDTESAFAKFLQKNQNDVFYGPILQQYVGIRLQPYIRKEGPVEYVSASIDTENPELKNYVVGTTFGKKYIGETASAYKNYKEQQQNLAKFHLTGATAEQIATFQRKRNNHQARIKPEYLKKIQENEDQFNHESVLRHSQSTRDSMPYIKKGSVDKYIYDSVLTLTKDYVTLLLQTPEGKKLLKEKKYIDNPFMPGMRLNFAKGNVDSLVRDSFLEKFGDGIDDFKKAWEEGRREEVGRSIGSLVGGTVAAGATTILTGGSGIWAAGAAFTVGSRAGGSLGGMIGAGFEGKSWSEIGNAGLVGLGVGERDQNGTFVNYFKDAKGNVTQDSLLHGAGRMGISLGTDYLSSVATFGIGNKIGLDKWAGKFVGAGWKQFASQGAVFGAEELFIENFLVDIPANTLQAGVSSFFLGNAIQDVGPRSAKLSQNTNTNKQIDPNNPTATQWDIKAALGAMATTFSQNISPENLGQTFAATLAYGGMLSGGRSAINKVAVALPALSVKNINDISTSYQSHLSDLQTKFPTLQVGKDMKSLTLDGKVLDQTHPRFGELEGSLKALQVLGKSFTDEMDKISQIQQGLTDPSSPEAKKRGLIYGWKLLHPRMTPLEVMDGRITKLKKEITTEKNATKKSQKEALLQQMENVKSEIEGKSNSVVGNNKTENDDQPQESKENIDFQNSQIEINNIDDKKSEIYLKIGPMKFNKTILSTQDKELLHKMLGAKDMVLGSNILDLHRGETNDASEIKSGFKALQEKLLQAKNNGEELPSHILGLSNLSFVLGKYGFSILDKLPVEVYTQVGQYKRLFGELDLNNPLTENEMKQKERIGQNNDGKNPIKAAIIDIESFLKLDFNVQNNNPELLKGFKNIINSPSDQINKITTNYPDLLKNIINPETLQAIIQSEMTAGNLILNTDGSIKEVYTEVAGEKKPSQLFAKMKADGFSEQQALKTWLQIRTPEFKNRFGDRTSTDKSQVSKVVDENGEPLVVYHGSRTEIQDGIFKLPKDLEQTKTPMEGISTTSSKQVAIDYANKYHHNFEGGIIYPLFVNIKNSVSLDHVGEYNSYMKYLRKAEGLFEKYNIKSYEELKEFEHHMTSNTNEYLSQDEVNYKGNIFTKEEFIELWGMGFDLLLFVPNNKDNISGLKNPIDGITFNPHIDGNFSAATSIPYDQQLVFDHKNIKSAIDNDGSFSPETAKFNDYFGKESRFGFDSKQARDHSTFMDQFSGQATPEQIDQIRQKIEAVAQMYTDKTGKKLELTDIQIQAIIDTHLLPGQLGQLTQAELLTKNRKLAEAIPDADVRRFLLEAGFCGKLWDKLKGFFNDKSSLNVSEGQQELIRELSISFIGDMIEKNIRDDISTRLVTKVGIQSYEELKTVIYNHDVNNPHGFDPDMESLILIKKLAPQLDKDFFLQLRSQTPNMKLRDIVYFLQKGGKNNKDNILSSLREYTTRMELLSNARDLLFDKYSDIKHLDQTRTTLAMRNFFYYGNHIDTYEEYTLLIEDIKRELGLDNKMSWNEILEQRSTYINKIHKEVIESSDYNNVIYKKFFHNNNNEDVLVKYENNHFLFELAKFGMGHITDVPDISQMELPDISVINFINSGTLDGLDKNMVPLLSNTFTSKNKNSEYCTNAIPTFMASIRDGSGIRFIDKNGSIFYTKYDAKIKTSLKIDTKNSGVDFGGVSDLDFMIGKFVYKNKGLLSVEEMNKQLQEKGLDYKVIDNRGSLEVYSNDEIKFESVNGQVNTNIFREDGNPGSYWGAVYGNVTETELFKVYGDVVLELNAMRAQDVSIEKLIQFYEKGKILASQLKKPEQVVIIDKILEDLHNKGTNRYMQIMNVIISNIHKPPGNILQEIGEIYNWSF